MGDNVTTIAEPGIIIRSPESIYHICGEIVNGTFEGRWHFSFGDNYDPEHMEFGPLRVFNDDILSPGAVWPLHPHYEIEVVTYCAEGEFRHADHRGKGGILKKGWVQHTTVGTGMMHSEINNRPDIPMRFIQMWFMPSQKRLKPAVEQRAVEKDERLNKLLPLVSNEHKDALRIHSGAQVHSCLLQKGHVLMHSLAAGHGAYIYVLEGDPVEVSGNEVPVLGAAQVTGESNLPVSTGGTAEILLIDVVL